MSIRLAAALGPASLLAVTLGSIAHVQVGHDHRSPDAAVPQTVLCHLLLRSSYASAGTNRLAG